MPKEGGVHRLQDILVEEVSLVDRAANKRRFLLVKREGGKAMLKPDGRGGFTKISKADETNAEDTEKKAPPFGGAKAPPFGKKPEEETEKKAPPPFLKKPEAEEAEKKAPAAAAAAGAAAEEAEEAAEEAEEAEEEAEKAKKAIGEFAGDVTKALTDLAKAKTKEELMACKRALGAAVEKASFFENEEKRKAAAKSETTATSPAPAQTTADVTKALEAVEKIGAKMSGKRKEVFQRALGDLQGLMKELVGDDTTKSALAKRDEDVKVTKALTDATEVIKRQAAEIDRLKKSIPASNATKVEKSTQSATSAEPPWPLDMNEKRPTHGGSIASVNKKDESFYDD